MGEIMGKMNALIIIIAVIAILIPHAIASDRYSIYVRDSYNNIAPNAYVEVWIDNNKIDYGNADNGGIFYSYLDSTIRYHIYARGNGQYGDWQGYPPSGNALYIQMHQ
jgi:hypothetical protein